MGQFPRVLLLCSFFPILWHAIWTVIHFYFVADNSCSTAVSQPPQALWWPKWGAQHEVLEAGAILGINFMYRFMSLE
jgi:hypothetical protein